LPQEKNQIKYRISESDLDWVATLNETAGGKTTPRKNFSATAKALSLLEFSSNSILRG
jgi:hypothetical protein